MLNDDKGFEEYRNIIGILDPYKIMVRRCPTSPW
jgi:hypothetical protein